MEINIEQDQLELEQNPLDMTHDDIGGFSFRFYLLKLRKGQEKAEWLKIGYLVGTIFTAKQREKLDGTNFAILARNAYKKIVNAHPELLEMNQSGMSFRLTEQGLAAVDGLKSSHDLPGEITKRKKAKTEEQLAEDKNAIKRKKKELTEATETLKEENARLVQSNLCLNQKVTELKREMQEEHRRAELEMGLMKREMDTIMDKFSIETDDDRSHVQRLLHENIELVEREREANKQLSELKERMKNFQLFPLNIKEWPECITKQDFTKEYNYLNSVPLKSKSKEKKVRKNLKGVDLALVDTSVFGLDAKDLFSRFIRREDFLRKQKLALKSRQQQLSGAIATTESNRGAECKSALAIFFGFVQLTVKPEKLDLRYLFEKELLESWFIFYSGRVSSPNTVGNNAKYLSQFFNFLLTEPSFQGYLSILAKLGEFFKTLREHTKKAKENLRAEQATEEAMFLLGKWLFHDEVVTLHKNIVEQTLELLTIDKQYLKNNEPNSRLSMVQKHHLMVNLILLCFMDLGGQRREFIKGMTIENLFVLESDKYVYRPPPEKTVRQHAGHFVIASHVAKLLKLWQCKYHPSISQPHVIAMWITKDGRPMSKQITNAVADLVEVYYPGRRITPGFFRRAIITFLVKIKMDSDSPQACSIWERQHATLMNTSPPVLHNNYIRLGMAEQNEITLNEANMDIGLVPNEEMQNRLNELSAVHEASLEARRKRMVKILEQKVDSSHSRTYLVQYDDGEEEWVTATKLHGARQIISEFMERNAPLQNPSVIRLKESIRSAAAQTSVIVNNEPEGEIPTSHQSVLATAPSVECSVNSLHSSEPTSSATSNNYSVTDSSLLVPTFNLCSPLPMPVFVPSLVSTLSSPWSSPNHNEDIRTLATSIADQITYTPSHALDSSSSQTWFPHKPGDWDCNRCGYTNFAYRQACRECNDPKKTLKRKAVNRIDDRALKKQSQDIVEVLAKGLGKRNEVIYQVISRTKGKLWVNAKHVPSHMIL